MILLNRSYIALAGHKLFLPEFSKVGMESDHKGFPVRMTFHPDTH